MKSSYNNNKFKISAPTWSDKLELPDGSYLISDIQDYSENIVKRHNKNTDDPSMKIYVNKIENRITFQIKKGYYLELLTSETIKLLKSTESKITKDKNGKNVPHLEIIELVLVHCSWLIMVISKIQECYIHLIQINHLVVYWKFHQEIIYF